MVETRCIPYTLPEEEVALGKVLMEEFGDVLGTGPLLVGVELSITSDAEVLEQLHALGYVGY